MSVLKHKVMEKFDPKSQAHLIAFADFRATGRLGTPRFELEESYDNVVTMMNQKIVEAYLEQHLK